MHFTKGLLTNGFELTSHVFVFHMYVIVKVTDLYLFYYIISYTWSFSGCQ